MLQHEPSPPPPLPTSGPSLLPSLLPAYQYIQLGGQPGLSLVMNHADRLQGLGQLVMNHAGRLQGLGQLVMSQVVWQLGC